MAAIIALQDFQGPTKPSMRHGQFGEHTEDRLADIQATAEAYVKACNGLFRDYGIDLSQRFDVVLGQDRQVHVEGDHPDKQKIEELLNGSYLLRNTASMLLGKVAHHETVVGIAAGGSDIRQSTEFSLSFQAGGGALSLSIYFKRQRLYAAKEQEDLEADVAGQQLQEVKAAEETFLRQKQQQEDWLKDKLLRDEAAERTVEKALEAAAPTQVQPTYI